MARLAQVVVVTLAMWAASTRSTVMAKAHDGDGSGGEDMERGLVPSAMAGERMENSAAITDLTPTPTPTPTPLIYSCSGSSLHEDGNDGSAQGLEAPAPSTTSSEEVAAEADPSNTLTLAPVGTVRPAATSPASASPSPSRTPTPSQSTLTRTISPAATPKTTAVAASRPTAVPTTKPSVVGTPIPRASTSPPTKSPSKAPTHAPATTRPASTATPAATTAKPAATTKPPVEDTVDVVVGTASGHPTTEKPTKTAAGASVSTTNNSTNAQTSVLHTNTPTAPALRPLPSTGAPVSASPLPSRRRKTPTIVDNIVIKTSTPPAGSQGSTSRGIRQDPAKSGVLVIRQSEHKSVVITTANDTVEYQQYDRASVKKHVTAIDDTAAQGATANTSVEVATIGGRNRTAVVPGADVEVSAMTDNAYDAMRIACCSFAIASMVVLLLYHTLALVSPAWLCSGDKDVSSLSPNTWELLFAASFFQHLGSLSMLVLPKAPHYVVDFTDAFSWTNFQLGAMGTNEPTRRLDYVIIMGMVAYADRLGIDEGWLLAYTTRCFFTVVGVLVVSFIVAASAHRCFRTKRRQSTLKTTHHDTTLCFLGLAVAVWALSAFPLAATSIHELSMQVDYAVTSDLAVVVFNLVAVLLGGLVLLSRSVSRIRSSATVAYYQFAVFGTLYADHRRETHHTFVALTLFQLFSGAVVGGIHENPMQLIALLGLHGLVLLAIAAVRPYRKPLVNAIACGLMAVRITNLLLATAFTTTSTIATPTRGSVTSVFLLLNFVVVLAIFFRQFLVFVYVLRLWSSRPTPTAPSTNVPGDVGGPVHTEIRSARLGSEYDPTSRQWATQLPLTPSEFSDAEAESPPVPNLANRPAPVPFRYKH